MTVKEMYQMVLDLVGLEQMPEDSGIVFDNGKDVKKVLAGIDMDSTMLMIAKQLGFDCVAQHHPAGIINAHVGDLFGRDHMKKLMECGVPVNEAQRLAYASKVRCRTSPSSWTSATSPSTPRRTSSPSATPRRRWTR